VFSQRWKDKFYGREDIKKNLARYSGTTSRDPGAGKYGTTGHDGEKSSDVPWAEPPNKADGAFERRRYYALVSVQIATLPSENYEIDPNAEGCTSVTLALLMNRPSEFEGRGGLTGMTRAEFRSNFERLVENELAIKGLTGCSGDLRKDVQAIWRHSRR
jgi:hypothetical protein